MTLRFAAEQLVTIEQVRASENCACITEGDLSDDELNDLIDAVSDAIARITGMRISGRRQLVARPCRIDYHLCTCCSLDGVPLGDNDPVVDLVKINGDTLDPATYELHRTLIGWNLVKRSSDNFRPSSWPSAQSLWKPDTEDDTFAIYFTEGIYIDDHVITIAALEIICDWASDGWRTSNSLEEGIISANLGGVTVQVDSDRFARIRLGLLGPMTARLMGLFVPGGASPSTVWAPEMLDGWDLHIRLPS